MLVRTAHALISLGLLLAPLSAFARDPAEIQNYLETYYDKCEQAGSLLLDYYVSSPPRIQRAAQFSVDCRCLALTEAVKAILLAGGTLPSDAEHKPLLDATQEDRCAPPVP